MVLLREDGRASGADTLLVEPRGNGHVGKGGAVGRGRAGGPRKGERGGRGGASSFGASMKALTHGAGCGFKSVGHTDWPGHGAVGHLSQAMIFVGTDESPLSRSLSELVTSQTQVTAGAHVAPRS